MPTIFPSPIRARRSRTLLAPLVAAGVVSFGSVEARAANLIECLGTEYDLRAMIETEETPESFSIESGSLDDGSIRIDHAAFASVFPDGLPFFGLRTEIFANNNGNLTFGESMTSYTPDAIPGLWQPTIAPWFGDVDFRTDGGTWTMCVDPEADHVLFTWRNVGYFSGHDDKQNSFQIVLVDADETCSEARNFDMEFRYHRLEWTTGDASGGHGGLGGVPAVAGIDAGDGTHALALPDSGTGAVLGLVSASNVEEPGLFSFYLTEHGLPTCGDGIVDECEACDDGNDDNTDACTNLCQPAVCGDGFVWAGEESCDGAAGDLACPKDSEGSATCNDACALDVTGCIPTDPCAVEGVCAANAACTVVEAEAHCTCPPGYEGDGHECVDTDECGGPSSPCGAHGLCTNTAGSFVCECALGFEGDGFDCVDVDECAFDDAESCGAHATCVNHAGGFHCACDEGFRRVEDVCVDIDECEEGNHACDPTATCSNLDGSYECACPEGSAAEGHTCVPIGAGGTGGGSGEGGGGGEGGDMGDVSSSSTSSGQGASTGEGGDPGGAGGCDGSGASAPGTGSASSPPEKASPGAVGETTQEGALDDGGHSLTVTRRPGKPGHQAPPGKRPRGDDAGADDADADADDTDPASLGAGGSGLACSASAGGADPSALATLVAVFALLGARRRRS